MQALNIYDFVNIPIPTYVESSQAASGDVGVRKMGFHVKRDPIHLGLCRSLFIEPTKSRFWTQRTNGVSSKNAACFLLAVLFVSNKITAWFCSLNGANGERRNREIITKSYSFVLHLSLTTRKTCFCLLERNLGPISGLNGAKNPNRKLRSRFFGSIDQPRTEKCLDMIY